MPTIHLQNFFIFFTWSSLSIKHCPFPPPQLLSITILLSVSMNSIIWGTSSKYIHTVFVLFARLVSLSISSKFIHVVTCQNSFLFLRLNTIPWHVYITFSLSVHLFIDTWSRSFDHLLHTTHFLCVHAKSLQLRSTLWDPMDCSPPGSPAHGILPARILEWVAMPSSRGSSRPWK